MIGRRRSGAALPRGIELDSAGATTHERSRSHAEELAGGVPRRRDAGARAGDLAGRGRRPAARELVSLLYRSTGHAHAVGFTGAPGRREVDADLGARRGGARSGLTVGVISVDPSSPFTQGALLGDRIRLADHFLDPGVFIRSMGTRGHAGGLAEATLQAVLSSMRPARTSSSSRRSGRARTRSGCSRSPTRSCSC